MTFLFGAGGFGREVQCLIEDLVHAGSIIPTTSYFVVADGDPKIGSIIRGVPVISDVEFYSRRPVMPSCVIAVGSNSARRSIVERLEAGIPGIEFPVLLHPTVLGSKRSESVSIGAGSIIAANCILTTNIQIGRFVHLDIATTVSHDASIGDYCRLSPGARLCGGVRLGPSVFIGANAVVREGVSICSGALIGAGAAVVTSIDTPGTYVGVPARRAK